MKVLPIIDIETYATIGIDQGSHVYATHPDTEVLCVVIDDLLWRPGDPIPDVPSTLSAWNAEFDRLIYDHILVPRYGWPRVYDWDCLMVRAYAANLPGSLEKCGEALGVPMKKDRKGHALMLSLCKPAAPIKSNSDPKRKHTPANLQRLYMYCMVDVAASRAIAELLPPLSPVAKTLQRVDRRMNGHGMLLDMELARAIDDCYQSWRAETEAAFAEVTGLESNRGRAFLQWLESRGVRHEDGRDLIGQGGFNAHAVSQLIKALPEDSSERAALVMHAQLQKTSLAKVQQIIGLPSRDHRMRGLYQLFGAHQTCRYAGRRLQPQNLPRGSLKPDQVEEAIHFAHQRDVHCLASLGEVPSVLTSLLRSCIIASPGCMLVDADYSNVEGRIAAWLAGEKWKIRAFEEFDAGRGHDLYNLCYSRVFNTPIEKVTRSNRVVGKVLDLACGYAGGLGAISAWCDIYGLDMDEATKLRSRDLWREAHPAIVQLWHDLNQAFRFCTVRGVTKKVGLVTFRRSLLWDRALEIVLPSGRCLTYHKPFARKGEMGFWGESTDGGGPRQWMERRIFGGLILENLAQAISFDLMADAMVRLHARGYVPVMTTHDEIALEVPESRAEVALDEMRAIMGNPPAWAAGLPLAAGGWVGPRFRKD